MSSWSRRPINQIRRAAARAVIGRLLGGLLIGAALSPAHAAPLNDTGITWGGNANSDNNADCSSDITVPHDCHQGRDAAAAAGVLTKVGGGNAGFDFTALDASGNPTTPSSGTTPHPCVRDNVTGLWWEVKTDDGGLRDKDHTYTWYDSVNNYLGSAGTIGTNTCGGILSGYSNQCNTQYYVAAINAAGLCGYNDWRMPTVKELVGIVDLSRRLPAIDTGYFPNTPPDFFWSGSPDAVNSGFAWVIDFYYGRASSYGRLDARSVRLVRGGH